MIFVKSNGGASVCQSRNGRTAISKSKGRFSYGQYLSVWSWSGWYDVSVMSKRDK